MYPAWHHIIRGRSEHARILKNETTQLRFALVFSVIEPETGIEK